MLTDTIGLNLALEVASVYLFLLIVERFLFKTALTFLLPGGFALLIKKAGAVFLMKVKFSFDISPVLLAVTWFTEVLLLCGIYFLYLRRYEQT